MLETKSRACPASMLGPRLTRAFSSLSGAVLVMIACAPASSDPVPAGTSVYDAGVLHRLGVELDTGDFERMIETYQTSGDKEWIAAAVTIDGARFEDVGLRLKGSSSLRVVDSDADPAELPWLLRLDEYVEGQDLDGYKEFVARSNTSQTSLNEAVALDLLEAAGLASERAFATSFSVNGGDEVLRLVVQHLDDTWDAENFDTDGILYKAESGGDYSYRGRGPRGVRRRLRPGDRPGHREPRAAHRLPGVREQRQRRRARRPTARAPRHRGVRDLPGVPGPGGELRRHRRSRQQLLPALGQRWDGESGQFTVVAWDHNLAFGGILGARGPGAPGVRPGAGGPAAGGEPPDDMPSPETRGRAGDPVPPGGPASPAGGGFPDGSNVLVERFLGKEEFAALYDNAVADLRDTLFDSGLAEDILTQWSTLMTQAAALVDPDTVAREAADPRRGRARCRRLSAGQRRTTPPWRGPPLLLTHWRPWHRSADRVATSWRDRRERGGAAGAARRPRHPPAPKVPA